MAFFTIYEPQYLFTGWVDDGGMAMASWLDRDLAADSSGTIIKLAEIDAGAAGMFTDPDVFFTLPPITVEVTASFFADDDLFFVPMSVRALTMPDEFLKNEVRRVR